MSIITSIWIGVKEKWYNYNEMLYAVMSFFIVGLSFLYS